MTLSDDDPPGLPSPSPRLSLHHVALFLLTVDCYLAGPQARSRETFYFILLTAYNLPTRSESPAACRAVARATRGSLASSQHIKEEY